MQSSVFDWLGHEWLWLRAEGSPVLDAEEQTADIFARMSAQMGDMGLSPADTVRTRLWARDRQARDRGSRIRATTLVGAARSASSSFIAPEYFDSNGAVAIELWAMRPVGSRKTLVEYEPAIVPLRYVAVADVVVLSGVTSTLPTLQEQVTEIQRAVEGSLEMAGVGWQQVVKISSHLHRSQSLGDLRALLIPMTDGGSAELDFGFVDGYSTPGKLVEVEVTARVGR